jgi:5-methyltetrahydrofolate--homocysteine methyltransferase
MSTTNQELHNAILKGNRNGVTQIVQSEIANGVDIVNLLMNTMIPAMREVGDRFSRGEAYVPEMLIAARAMQAGLKIIEPILAEKGHQPIAKVCIGTVMGDLHDIGKNLVAMMLKGAGYAVDDLGVDCRIEKYQEAIDRGSQVICLSALLTTTMPYMVEVVNHFKSNPNVKIVIGGAPITESFAREIGAHGFATNASEAVNAVARVLKLQT